MPSKLNNRATGGVALNSGSDVNGNYIVFENGIRIYSLTVAITKNVTTTTAPAGSLSTTSNAAGLGKLFSSDGTKWQLIVATAEA